MGWKEETAMSNKQHFISSVLEDERPFSSLCKDFNITRQCGYKWLKRYKEIGLEGLKEKSRRPHSSPSKTSTETEIQIIEVRNQHPSWGGRKIYAYLKRKGSAFLPNPSTITRILHRHYKIQEDQSIKHTSFKRFEHQQPNDLWQMDFKGHFPIGTERCHPLTVIDDHSRFSLNLHACKNEQKVTVQNSLIAVFREYGLPERMTMDNGTPWGLSSGVDGYTSLEVWLILLGIRVSHSRPLHPQTQGKDERFHRTLKEEVLKRREFTDFDEAQRVFNEWRDFYNNERPHEACKMLPPCSKYRPSKKQYPEKMPSITYDLEGEIRKISSKGILPFRGSYYYMSESMSGMYVNIVESDKPGVLKVYLNHQKVKEIDTINKRTARKII
jgi:transposase InsO family protein